MSKLNLYQCLAVAKPHYEDVFCLGQHVLIDTGQCVMKAAGAPFPTPAGRLSGRPPWRRSTRPHAGPSNPPSRPTQCQRDRHAGAA